MTSPTFWSGEKPKEGEIINVLGLGLMKVLRVFDSHCRSVIFGEKLDISGQRWIVKTFNIDGDSELSSEDAARVIESNILLYHDRLGDNNVSVVGGLGFASYTEGETTQLVQFEEWAGETVSVSLKDFSFEAAERIVRAIWQQVILPIFKNAADPTNPGWLSVGLDLNPRNITSTGNSDQGFKVTCIDLFPWKLKFSKAGGWAYSLEYPEPTDPEVIELGKFRHFSMAGLILNFWINLAKELPQAAQFFYDLLERLIREFDCDKKYKLEESIDAYIQNRDLEIGRASQAEITDLITSWGMKDVFRIRMLGCTLAFHRNDSRNLLGELFSKYTHFQNSPIGPVKLQAAKKILISMASFPVTF